MNEKHYELLGANCVRYVKSMLNKEVYSDVEVGKAIAMIVQMVEREAERDSREEKNKAQG